MGRNIAIRGTGQHGDTTHRGPISQTAMRTKDGKKTISKFSKKAMNVGDKVYEHEIVLRKVYLVYDQWIGNDSIFPLSNGAPKIMTKFKDKT
jgi:hypothetical protein